MIYVGVLTGSGGEMLAFQLSGFHCRHAKSGRGGYANLVVLSSIRLISSFHSYGYLDPKTPYTNKESPKQ